MQYTLQVFVIIDVNALPHMHSWCVNTLSVGGSKIRRLRVQTLALPKIWESKGQDDFLFRNKPNHYHALGADKQSSCIYIFAAGIHI